MLNVSSLYETIYNGEHWIEYRLLVEAEDNSTVEVNESELYLIRITEDMVGNKFSIGGASSAQIDVEMIAPVGWTPALMAKLQPQFRVVNRTQQSEWLPKGIFYIDTRDETKTNAQNRRMTIHGYDAMLMAEQDYPAVNWNTKSDASVLNEICTNLGWTLDSETAAFFETTRAGYVLPTPFNYTYREVLQSIATVNCGNFVMDEYGHLRLVRFNALPTETYYLITPTGNYITFGGDRIVLQ